MSSTVVVFILVVMMGCCLMLAAVIIMQQKTTPPTTTNTTNTPTDTGSGGSGGGTKIRDPVTSAPRTGVTTGGRLTKPGKPLPASAKIVGGDPFANLSVVPNGIRGMNKRCTFHYYSPDYNTGSIACADKFHSDPNYSRKLLRLPWVAFCLGKWSTSVCGKCFRVTNRRTGAQINVRAVDQCGFDGMDVDPAAFNSIDTDGQGIRDGHMYLDITEVQCPRDASF